MRPQDSVAPGELSWCRDIDWGSAPDWVGAAGASLAFLLALWIYWTNSQDKRKEQARLVSLVPNADPFVLSKTGTSIVHLRSELPTSLSHLGATHYDVGEATRFWELNLKNLSNETISGVEGEILDCQGRELVRFDEFSLLKPQADETFTVVSTAQLPDLKSYTVRCRFTDAAGRRWRRDHLKPIKQLRRWNRGYHPR